MEDCARVYGRIICILLFLRFEFKKSKVQKRSDKKASDQFLSKWDAHLTGILNLIFNMANEERELFSLF